MGNNVFRFREAEKKDIPLVLRFVKELALYEDLLDTVKATEESLTSAIFEKNTARAFFGEIDGDAVCFSVIYYTVSTFIGKRGIFIEDLYVQPEYRGFGYGKQMLLMLSELAKAEKCWGLQWECLDWNEKSQRFYESLGAVKRKEWIIYRLKA